MAKLDELTIEIKDNAKETARNFDTLSNSLKKLSNVDTKSVYKNLNSVSRILKNFSNEIKSLDTSKINSLATAMNSMASSTKKSMQSASKSVDNVNKTLSNSTKKSQQSYEEFMASIKGLGKNQNFFGTSSQLDKEIASTQNKIEKIKTSLEAYNQEGKSVETKGWRTAQRQLEQYSNYLDNLIAKQNTATKAIPSGIDTMVNKNADLDNYQSRMAEVSEEVRSWYSEVEAQIRGFGSKAIDAGYFDKLRDIVMQPQIDNEKMLDQMDSLSLQLHNEFQKEPYKPQVFVDLDKVKQQTEQSAKQISETIKNKLDFEPTKLGQGQKYTQEYITLSKEISKAEKELTRYLNTQEKLDSLGVKNDSQRYKNVQLNIDQTDAKLQKLYQDMKILQTEGGDIINPNAFDNLSDKSSKAQSVMQSLTKALRTGGFGGAASIVQKLSANVGSLSSGLEMSGAAAETAGTAMAGLQTAIPVIGIILAAVTLLIKAFTSLAKVVINAAKKIGNGLKKIVTGVKNLVSSILSIGTSSYQAHTAVGKFINKVVNMFKSRILRQAITKAIEYAKQGFKDLEAYSANIGSPFHRNVQTIIADLKWLGRSIAAAFEPLINVATPILDFLIDKIVTVINYINQFFAALSGKSTWTKATKGASDYADATGGAAKAQKDLNKQIREWDKLNVITDPNKNNGGGGSSSSGASGDGFVTEDVSNNIKDLAKRIKETWDTDADFTWLGTEIGTKVKDTLDKIPWEEKIKPAAAKFGTALATTINGFVEVPGLADTIGKTIAQAINTALTFFENFTSNIHGDSIGTFIGELVGSALRNIEWDKYITSMGNLGRELAKGINALANTDVLSEISQSIAKLLKGAIEGAYQFVTNLDFKNLGTKIGNSISDFFKEMNEVDKDGMTGFQKLGKTVSGLATGVMDMISNALDNIKWDEVGQSVIDFFTSIDWVNLFTKAMELKDKISNAMWELFKLAVKTIGAINLDITVELLDKVKTKLQEAKDWLKDKFLDFKAKLPTIEEIKEKLEEFVGNVKAKLESTFGIKFPTLEDIKEKIEQFVNDVKSKLQSTFGITFPKWKDIKGKISDIKKNLKSSFKVSFKLNVPSWEKIKDKFTSIVNKIKSLFNLDLKFNSNKEAQTVTVSGGSTGKALSKAVSKAVKKTVSKTKKANGGIYSHGTWKNFATGGFPSHGTQFIAGEHGAEVVGHINGRTEVLNKSQIAQAMSSAVVSGNAEQNALLRQQNQLLMQILQKESGISYKDVFKATQKGNNEYKAMNGVSAFI